MPSRLSSQTEKRDPYINAQIVGSADYFHPLRGFFSRRKRVAMHLSARVKTKSTNKSGRNRGMRLTIVKAGSPKSSFHLRHKELSISRESLDYLNTTYDDDARCLEEFARELPEIALAITSGLVPYCDVEFPLRK